MTGKSGTPLAATRLLLGRYKPVRVWLGSAVPAGKTQTSDVTDMQDVGIAVSTLKVGQETSLGTGASLRVLADTADGAALLVEWQGLRVLVPGGVTIRDLRGLGLDGITALVLGPADLETQTPDEWAALGPTVVLWERPEARLDPPGWISLAGVDWVELATDGKRLWAEVGN